MIVARTLSELHAASTALRARHGALALVPTMGALHAGHRALVDAAVQSGAAVVTSIFVNPLQFAANEDLARYPRDEAGDLAILKDARCAVVWMPDVATMYPADASTTIQVAGPSQGWEGDARPGHFTGVATVCAKLFGQVHADRAYFGEKDWQQLQVVTRMVRDLHLPLEIVGIPTVREADGLALSSRNRFLTAEERALAPVLYQTMQDTAAAIAREGTADAALERGRLQLAARGFAVDYLALVDGPSLRAIASPVAGARLIAAAKLGTVRLLDNMAV